jgi:hypothetical protein
LIAGAPGSLSLPLGGVIETTIIITHNAPNEFIAVTWRRDSRRPKPKTPARFEGQLGAWAGTTLAPLNESAALLSSL